MLFSLLLCFQAILKKFTNYGEESAHYACILWHKKVLPLETVSGLTLFSSVSTVPRLLHLPARRDSRDLVLLCEVRKPRQACSIKKRLKHRFLGRAPEVLWLASEAVDSTTTRTRPAIVQPLDSLASCCSDLQSTTPFAEHYTCINPVKLPDYSRIMPYAFADRLFH